MSYLLIELLSFRLSLTNLTVVRKARRVSNSISMGGYLDYY